MEHSQKCPYFTKCLNIQFHTDTMNHYSSRVCYILLIFGWWNAISGLMQYFTFNLETKFLWKVLAWFSIMVHQMDYPDKLWRNPNFHVCPRVLDIYSYPLFIFPVFDYYNRTLFPIQSSPFTHWFHNCVLMRC